MPTRAGSLRRALAVAYASMNTRAIGVDNSHSLLCFQGLHGELARACFSSESQHTPVPCMQVANSLPPRLRCWRLKSKTCRACPRAGAARSVLSEIAGNRTSGENASPGLHASLAQPIAACQTCAAEEQTPRGRRRVPAQRGRIGRSTPACLSGDGARALTCGAHRACRARMPGTAGRHGPSGRGRRHIAHGIAPPEPALLTPQGTSAGSLAPGRARWIS